MTEHAMQDPAVGVAPAGALGSLVQARPAGALRGGMRGDEERAGQTGRLGRRGGLDVVAGERAAALVIELDLPLHRGSLGGALRRAMIAGVTTPDASHRERKAPGLKPSHPPDSRLRSYASRH